MAILEALNKAETLSDKAYRVIREAVIFNEIKPGEVLAEESLAKQLQISRTPVRAALQQLLSEGLVQVNDRKNMVVTEVGNKDVRDIDRVRLELEPLSVSLACQNGISREAEAELRGYCRAQLTAAREYHCPEFFKNGYKFHICLSRQTGNCFLEETIDRASTMTVRYLMQVENPVDYIDESGWEHEEILDLILEGEEEKARNYMKRHIAEAEPKF